MEFAGAVMSMNGCMGPVVTLGNHTFQGTEEMHALDMEIPVLGHGQVETLLPCHIQPEQGIPLPYLVVRQADPVLVRHPVYEAVEASAAPHLRAPS